MGEFAAERVSEEGTQWLTQEQQVAWRALLRGTSSLMSALDADLQPHGVSLSEYEILAMLSEQPARTTRMSALAEMVSQSRSRLTHAANRLERRGWVARQRSEHDGRGVLLSLTEAGHVAVQQLAPVHLESVRARVVDLMSDEDFVNLGRAMRVIADAMGPSAQGPTVPGAQSVETV
ncbi:MAG: MarR family transcriptional regulator [Dermatophilus congolensis]|nr:MarR family transcriptional regulator [Dermatophilus congolensis]